MKDKAKKLIDNFYKCMPFKDGKLTSCNENDVLIKNMELISAIQCAIICVEEILLDKPVAVDEETVTDRIYWESVLDELKSRL